jgi:8-oxo-dGTP pyrophosphatase MutT (NUDIX family)
MSWIESLKEYSPCNEQERKDKEIVIKSLDLFDDILSRDNEIIHITSSAFVINKNKDKVLMVHHNIYNSWSLTGGHADGEEDLLLVAINEVKEETGVKNICPVSKDIFSLDVLSGFGHMRKGKYVSSHLHISVTYLLVADENEPLIIKIDENSAVKWISLDEIDVYSNEPHMKKIYAKIVSKIKS